MPEFNRREIVEILENHDQEIRVIDEQIANERRRLDADLESIRSRLYLGGVRYDEVRVQSSPQPSSAMVNMLTAQEIRQQISDSKIALLEGRKQEIETVYSAVLRLNSHLKCVLLALYYPARTTEQAAEFLGVSSYTVKARKRSAIDELAEKLKNLPTQSYPNLPHAY